MWKLLLVWAICGFVQAVASPDPTLADFLAAANQQLAAIYDQSVLAQLQSELRGPNDVVALLELEIADEKLLNYVKTLTRRAAKFKRLQLGDASQKRQLARMPQLGYEALNAMELSQVYAMASSMGDSYRNVKLCAYKQPGNCTLRLIPEVQAIVQQSRDLDEIEYYWFEWRQRTGLATRGPFVAFMELYKKTAQVNGYPRAEDYWFRSLEKSGTQSLALLDRLMAGLRPLFLQFHAHVRGSLRKMHGERLVPRGKPYPQHLAEVFIGNAFRRVRAEWYVDLPSPETGLANITQDLHRRGLSTTQRVFWNVAEYFRGLGLPLLESDLWTNAQSVAADDDDRCWHKVWRYYTLPRTNLTYCPLNDEERFFNMFEAQSDLYYYRAASGQPTLLRDEPFPNFSDAIGKCFSLAASSPRYLQKLGLLQEGKWLELPARLNRLYVQGLRVVFLLPVFYVLDRYRVEVLSGHIRADDNEAYWRLTEHYTGAAAPRKRTNEQFDVPAKMLMEVDDQYFSNILSIVLQFQLLKHYCTKTQQFEKDNPRKALDLCDLSDQRQIGASLQRAISLGSSVPYSGVLQEMAGEPEVNIDGLLTYFKPLHDWLVQQNQLKGLDVGWAYDGWS
ncbi:angiotensin-converting enzyme [Drosophila guanche]|uniref:Angiotensin-converting enzyme n=1 Tax=Drosophila guanche TaxID=7266 RepID=A0A3B0K8X7_DROGU|nr:angiotensin-converting enzyme [Drosophila guanche]SPP82519.1 blast:Angiotensin-converting enzyme [Drosophila guanche]